MLHAEDVSKHFGGVRALHRARLDVAPGEVHALVGENGAGKSTLAKIVAGSVEPDSGTIRVEGRPAMIYQELDLFPSLTVADNLKILNPRTDAKPWLDLVGLSIDPRRRVELLPIAERQLLAIARALSQEARVILMDEPTSSLFGDDVERLFRLIGDLKNHGVAVVYVSHKLEEIFRVSDRITVMRDGETIQTLETARTDAAEVIRLMVGRDVDLTPRSSMRPRGRAITCGALELYRGEVLGVAGLVGSGRSELLASLLAQRSTGMALVPEDRREQGLMMQMSVTENLTLPAIPSRWGFVRTGEESGAAGGMARRLALRCSSLDAPVGTLSGGNQQKVLLGRWLLRNPEVLLLDDPTRGIDIGAKQDIYRIIDELAGSGMAIVLVSSELPELLHCADRIAVLRQGQVVTILEGKNASPQKIMAAAT